MKKYLEIILLIVLISSVAYILWIVVPLKTYRIVDVELTQENVFSLQQSFGNFKLPEGAKVEKASKIVCNGTQTYVKVTMPLDKINEFSSLYEYSEKEPVTEFDIELHKLRRKTLDWWNINVNNADFKIRIYKGDSKENNIL
ncbi:hypothetical protein [Pseudobacteroides cellulosolvens]|uniref:Uncharacterized protein n=1 Tax=Pseudobacteroides cellulosolvens ATCC 35603 = DSM 2933 TaxID=398512 RepID=A0A0L6JRA7_9FIRM|nr:hypothetical protein [Pseudobacteroides cellulosolvens]KNY27927.1 hypothetical protein Bccel_3198 [Pseudobacteroides cellulosolvens ATCC 35603 = DSM 2933]